MVIRFGLMDRSMKVNFMEDQKMAWVSLSIQMVMSTRANTRMIREKEEVNIHIAVDKSMRACGRMTLNMAKEQSECQMEADSQETSSME